MSEDAKESAALVLAIAVGGFIILGGYALAQRAKPAPDPAAMMVSCPGYGEQMTVSECESRLQTEKYRLK